MIRNQKCRKVGSLNPTDLIISVNPAPMATKIWEKKSFSVTERKCEKGTEIDIWIDRERQEKNRGIETDKQRSRAVCS